MKEFDTSSEKSLCVCVHACVCGGGREGVGRVCVCVRLAAYAWVGVDVDEGEGGTDRSTEEALGREDAASGEGGGPGPPGPASAVRGGAPLQLDPLPGGGLPHHPGPLLPNPHRP